MISFPLPPKISQKGKNKAIFEIEGLYPGYGVTVGNALRRVLLSSLQGSSVTEVKITGAPHEFSTMEGVLEDTIMILLNIKNLRFKMFEGEIQKVELKFKGEGEVKGSDFKLPSQVKLVNPEQHIATITDKKTEFNVELTIQKGIGYEPKAQRKTKKGEIGIIELDAIYTPIRNVSFRVENMRVGDRTDFDRLNLEVETDGTITPEESFYQACEILIKHFNIIFTGNPEGANAKSEVIEEASAEEQEESSEDITKKLVEEMKLTGRTLSVLVKNNIKTVAGLIRKSEKSLTDLEGMGEKSLSEIKRRLKKMGLELKNEE